MSETNALNWLRGQAPQATMKDLWKVIMKESWQEELDLAVKHLEDIGLDELLSWAIRYRLGFSSKVISLITKNSELSAESSKRKVHSTFKDCPKEVRELLNRLQSICEDRGLDFLNVLNEAKDSRNLASLLQKNPTKSTKYESIVVAFIEDRVPAVSAVRLGDKETPLELRFDAQGNAITTTGASTGLTKSVDLAIFYRTSETSADVILFSHKYTRTGGGHQDNQKKDTIGFLENATKGLTANPATQIPGLLKLVQGRLGSSIQTITWEPGLILDGDYFSDITTTVMLPGGKSPFVGDTDQLVAFLSKLLRKNQPIK